MVGLKTVLQRADDRDSSGNCCLKQKILLRCPGSFQDLFSVLEATGADTISQIQEGGLKSLAAMVRQLDKLDPKSKAMVQELITGLFGSWLELLPLPELDKKRFLP